MAAIRRDEGRACPRVFLDADNALVVPLAPYLLQEHLRPAFAFAAEAHLGDLPPEDQRALLDRLAYLVRSKPIMDRLYPPLKK